MAILSRVLNHDRPQSSPAPHHHIHPHLPKSPAASSTIGGTSFVMSLNLESPPIILYGQPHESTGSIISGLLSLDIKSKKPVTSSLELSAVSSHSSFASVGSVDSPPPFEEFDLESVTLSLVQTIKVNRPFVIPSSSVSGCKNCTTRTNTLARWDVLTTRASFSAGTHAYPFSHLLPGSLPASSRLGSSQHSSSYIKYDLVAVAKRPHHKDVVVNLPLNISRSILRGPDRNSLRVFPPTEVTASAVLPSVVYPKSSFPIELKLDNIVSAAYDRRWRMRKLSWRIEEHIKVKAECCQKHELNLKTAEDSQKKLALHKELKSGGGPGTGSDHSGPSKSSGLHHSSVQTSMFMSNCPTTQVRGANLDRDRERAADSGMPGDSTPSSMAADENTSHDPIFAPVRSASSISLAAANSLSGAASSPGLDGSPQGPTSTPPADAHISPALYLDELRTISHGEIKTGWKSDFSDRGRIELVAEISAINCSTGLTRHITKKTSEDSKLDDGLDGSKNGANISCDIDDPQSGIYVGHTLIVEVVVAEELVQTQSSGGVVGKPKASTGTSLTPVASASSVSSTGSSPNANASSSSGQNPVGVPTGAARVLRMQFKLTVTERSGLGIAWDDEVPPTYEDVRTLSPPTYQQTSATSTPVSTPSTFIVPPPLAAHRSTPGILYGIGDTPVVGAFGRQESIDHLVDLDDRIQEFTL